MPAPDDNRLLLQGPPEGVNANAYLRMGAENRWAHLRGFNEFIHACVLDGGFSSEPNAFHAVRGALTDAVAIIPPGWKEIFPRGDWSICHPDQVTAAQSGPLCFDKACIILLATDIACKRPVFGALHGMDVFKHVSLHPAIYKLVGAESWYTLRKMFSGRIRKCEHALIGELKEHLLTCDPRDTAVATPGVAESFLSQALEGRAMTWKNANIIAKAFNMPVFDKRPKGDVPGEDCLSRPITVEMTDGRSDGGKFRGNKHCNQAEGPFVTLSSSELDALRKAVEKSAKAARG